MGFRKLIAVAALALMPVGLLVSCEPGGPAPVQGIFFDQEDVDSINTGTAAYARLESDARSSWPAPRFDTLEHDADVLTLAGALVANKERDAGLRQKVVDQLNRLNDSGVPYDRALELARNIGAYPVAADLIGFRGDEAASFRTFLSNVKYRSTNQGHGCGGTSLADTAKCGANNWGSMARFGVGAIDAYLNDDAKFDSEVQDPWLDYVGSPAFSTDPLEYESTNWACHSPSDENRAGIESCPSDLTRDGGLPEELRRSGEYTPPPGPDQNYVQGATQANVATWIVVARQKGGDSRGWGNNAVDRSIRFIFDRMQHAPDGNDAWLTYAWNSFSAAPDRPTNPLSGHGKIIDYTNAVRVDLG